MRRSIFLALSACTALVAAGCGGQDVAATMKGATPELTVTAADLIKAYDEDRAAANERFRGKIIIVEGFVEGVAEDPQVPTIHLDDQKTLATTLDAPLISCDFVSSSELPKAKTGDRVKVKGRCGGKMAVILLADCVSAK